MFNGIIFNKGLITKISKRSKGINIFVKSDLKLNSRYKKKSKISSKLAKDNITIYKR